MLVLQVLVSLTVIDGFLLPSSVIYTRGCNAAGQPPSRPCRSATAPLASRVPNCLQEIGDDLVVGLNKYSHDTSICILRERDGVLLFAGEKERVTRKKHDGGDTGDLVQHALDSIGASLEDVRLVVCNNHHYRVAPFERRLPWAIAQDIYPQSFAAPHNIIPDAAHAELSHHLAHVWSAIALAPFNRGLVVVMDGMGESYRAMAKAEARSSRENIMSDSNHHAEDDEQYFNDLRLMREVQARPESGSTPGFQQVPKILDPHEAYREAESAYVFAPGPDGGAPVITPIYKRWTRERSPPELYNHGFENMESMGAVYSRVSSHIFGDWNACGKVMGLAPWASRWPGTNPQPPRLSSGNLLADGDESFCVHWDAIEGLPRPNELGEMELRPFYATLAAVAQQDLEEAAMSFISGLKEKTGQDNLCLCGGVALNSVLNGRVAREAGFKRFFVPPCPGDEGIAIGCATFGWHQRHALVPSATADFSPRQEDVTEAKGHNGQPQDGTVNWEEDVDRHGVLGRERRQEVEQKRVALAEKLRTPFWGKQWSSEDIEDELEEWESFVDFRELEDLQEIADMIADGKVVAWFQGRGEFGPRALGSRSLLADPRDPNMRDRINTYVKKREDFRPFAPSVLAEEADEWFEGLPVDGSPYMSITAPTKPDALSKLPAVCHVDGSSRLQTVQKDDNPLYHRLISAFFARTGVPMVLNTSFNVMGEPIVDSPQDAIRALTYSAGAIDVLVLHDKIVTLRPFPADMKAEAGNEGEEVDLDVIVPYQVKSFLSEVISQDGHEVIRVRVMPQDELAAWIELEDAFTLQVLELADGDNSIGDLVRRTCHSEQERGLNEGVGAREYESEEQDGEEIDEEMAASVLRALQALYSKGLVGFDTKVML